jgi:1-acyl-sn-glycerol-3-phosphate acyltransferase
VKFLYFIGWSFYRILFTLYFRWSIYGRENVPASGPLILASNHASFLDPPLVGSALPREINYLARDTLFRFPIIGWILREVNAVPVDREGGGAAGLKAILDRLLAGNAIILFPEGTRTSDGNLQTPRAGIGLTVIKSNAPVVPVRIFGTYEAFGKRHKFPRPKKVSIVFGKPLDFSALRAEAKSCPKPRLKEIYSEVTAEIMKAISSLSIPQEK